MPRHFLQHRITVLATLMFCALGFSTRVPAQEATQEAAQEATERPREFGAEYAGLSAAQKVLIDDIYQRAGRITKRDVDPETAYNQARLSVRTTFGAVSHALTTSTLTDAETGESLGVALDLIAHLETVRGKVKGAKGDRQFRLYVVLEPDAVDRMNRSSEFKRKGDNTIFHKGYPMNYRQLGGVPAMQVSVSRDGKRADIDVDYRASSFPNALVNGHLTSANSDVRAGNYGRHTKRWDGLVNWWDGFFGSLFSGETYRDEDAEDHEFPMTPRAGNKTIDVATHDFLSSWLVEGPPNLAVAYFDREAFDCLAQSMEDEGQEFDPGLAGLQMYMRMKEVSDELGPQDGLEGLTIGVRLVNPNLKLVRQDHHRQFVLHGVPAGLAEQMKCGNVKKIGKLPDTLNRQASTEKVKHFLSTFFLKGARGRGVTLGLLWEQREGGWKIVSYEAEADAREGQRGLPDVREAVEVEAQTKATQQADPTLSAAVESFLETWIIQKDYVAALSTFSPSCYPCVNLGLDPGESPKHSAEEQAARLHAGISRFGDALGDVERLEDVIVGVEPWDPRLRIFTHDRPEAFGLLGLPDWAGEQADCEARASREDAPSVAGENKNYGRYFASAFQIETYAGEPAVLYLGWEKVDDDWKIFTYKVEDP